MSFTTETELTLKLYLVFYELLSISRSMSNALLVFDFIFIFKNLLDFTVLEKIFYKIVKSKYLFLKNKI